MNKLGNKSVDGRYPQCMPMIEDRMETLMKNKFTVTMSCFIILLLLLGFATAFAYGSPNYATNDHYDLLHYRGYVQCQPSYNDGGRHAARGYIRYFRYDIQGGIVGDTGRLYTEYGRSANDSRIYSRSTVYTDSLMPNPLKTQFYYGFDWVPDGTGIWPVNTHPITE